MQTAFLPRNVNAEQKWSMEKTTNRTLWLKRCWKLVLRFLIFQFQEVLTVVRVYRVS